MAYRWTLTNIKTLEYEVLTHDPIGWQDAQYTISRSDAFKGMNAHFVTSLKFHCAGGGKEFIDKVYDTDFIDGRIDVLVEYDCDGSGNYETLFNGLLNLAGYKSDGDYVTCNIEQSDLMTKLSMRDEISVNLETTTSIGGLAITAPAATVLQLPPVEIVFENEWVIEDGYAFDHTVVRGGGGYEVWVTHNMGLVKGDIDTAYPSVECYDDSTSVAGQIGAFELSTYLDPIVTVRETGVNYPITVDFDLHMQGTFYDDETSGGGFRQNESVQLKMIKGRIDVNDTDSIDDIITFNVGTYTTDNFEREFNIPFTGQFTLTQGESVWLVWQYTNKDSGNYTSRHSWVFNRSYLKLTSRTTYNATTAKTIMVHEAFNQVVDAIADSNNNFKSEFYGRTDSAKLNYPADGCGSQVAITNGLNIRKFPNKPILTSLKELYESFDSLHNIGMGIVDGKVRVEPLAYWYNNTTRIISLPFVATYSMKADEKKAINKIETGYQKWESEFKGGLDEPCTKHEYSTIVASAKNSLVKLAKFCASSYAIELTRRKNIDILPTEDWRYDNDNFIICTRRNGTGAMQVEQYAPGFTNGSNMQALTTAYNLRATPKRMLLAHLNVITAALQKIKGFIIFVKGEGNTALQLTKTNTGCPEDFDGQPLSESQHIEWSDDRAANIRPLWFPEVYSFEYPLTYQQFKTIKANPNGYIEFYRFEDDKKAGYILNMEYQLKTGMTKFELLRIFAPEAIGDENGNYIGETINDELIVIRG